jgi:hypothetical protein
LRLQILDHHCAGCERARYLRLRQRGGIDDASAGTLGPNGSEMALPRPRRAEDRGETVRLCGPGFDQAEGSRVRRISQKIVTAEALRVGQVKRELPGA